jgi:soluble lytic murein transglycosylase-like protein
MRACVFIGYLCLGLFSLSNDACADIYAFVDGDGTTHYSNVPADPRYEPVIVSAHAGAEQMDAREVLARSAPFRSIIDEAARASQIDAAFLVAVILVESGFDPDAVSSAGAQGLMQLMPVTAQRFDVDNPFDPHQNVSGGARYLRSLLDRYRDYELALAAYNAGEATVDRYGRRVPPFPETLRYVPRVMRVYSTLRDQLRTT